MIIMIVVLVAIVACVAIAAVMLTSGPSTPPVIPKTNITIPMGPGPVIPETPITTGSDVVCDVSASMMGMDISYELALRKPSKAAMSVDMDLTMLGGEKTSTTMIYDTDVIYVEDPTSGNWIKMNLSQDSELLAQANMDWDKLLSLDAAGVETYMKSEIANQLSAMGTDTDMTYDVSCKSTSVADSVFELPADANVVTADLEGLGANLAGNSSWCPVGNFTTTDEVMGEVFVEVVGVETVEGVDTCHTKTTIETVEGTVVVQDWSDMGGTSIKTTGVMTSPNGTIIDLSA